MGGLRGARRRRPQSNAKLSAGDEEVLMRMERLEADLRARIAALTTEITRVSAALTTEVTRVSAALATEIERRRDGDRTLASEISKSESRLVATLTLDVSEAEVHALDVAEEFARNAHARIDATLSWRCVAAFRALCVFLLRRVW